MIQTRQKEELLNEIDGLPLLRGDMAKVARETRLDRMTISNYLKKKQLDNLETAAIIIKAAKKVIMQRNVKIKTALAK